MTKRRPGTACRSEKTGHQFIDDETKAEPLHRLNETVLFNAL